MHDFSRAKKTASLITLIVNAMQKIAKQEENKQNSNRKVKLDEKVYAEILLFRSL